jgi:hypothetical protein
MRSPLGTGQVACETQEAAALSRVRSVTAWTQHRQIVVPLVAEPRIGVVMHVQHLIPPAAPLAAIARPARCRARSRRRFQASEAI